MPSALQLLLALAGLGLATARSLHFHYFGPEQHAREEHPIPHILHQAWPDEHLPSGEAARQETWRAHHPYWEYKCGPLPRLSCEQAVPCPDTAPVPCSAGSDARVCAGYGPTRTTKT